MPFLPDNNAMPLAGTINVAPFQIGNVIYPTGTLLFQPGEIEHPRATPWAT